LLRSPKFRVVVVYTKQLNLTLKLPFRIAVTISEYLNQHRYTPENYKGPTIREGQAEYYQQDMVSGKL